MRYCWIILLIAGLLNSCTGKKTEHAGRWFNVPSLFRAEKARYSQTQYTVNKTVQWGEEIFTAYADTVDFDRELSLWEKVDLNRPEWEAAFDTTIQRTFDGGQYIVYTSNNEKVPLRSLSVLYNGAGELLIIEADWSEKKWLTERSYKLSYQPGKGYNVRGSYRHFWEKPVDFEIHGEINNPAFLMR